jgi:pimeloyl-ACP methyl ester carboxylesterase
MPHTTFKQKKIHFTDQGKGEAIVFLHGFTEDSVIWKKFASRLEKKFRIICPDLPGHGKSECISSVHTMELQAEAILQVLDHLRIKKCLMVGHSMGGYVTQAFAGKYPGRLKGFVIFHSHCFADSAQEKKNRTRTVEVVRADRFGFVASFIPGLFPDESRARFRKEINALVKRAKGFPKEGIIAAIKGMRERKDQADMLRSTGLPVLFILGMKDPKAPVAKFWDMISLPAHSESLILRDCGHMGYIEYPDATLEALKHFAARVF